MKNVVVELKGPSTVAKLSLAYFRIKNSSQSLSTRLSTDIEVNNVQIDTKTRDSKFKHDNHLYWQFQLDE